MIVYMMERPEYVGKVFDITKDNWLSDHNGVDVGYDDLNVVGNYETDDGLIYIVDIESGEVLEAWEEFEIEDNENNEVKKLIEKAIINDESDESVLNSEEMFDSLDTVYEKAKIADSIYETYRKKGTDEEMMITLYDTLNKYPE